MQELLENLLARNRAVSTNGKIADYIPELAKASPDLFGIYVIDIANNEYGTGDYESPFTIQSISKIVTFICALMDCDFEKISRTISVEPTADGFNSIASLEIKNTHKPLNPMINAGAIATIPFVRGATYLEKFTRIMDFIKIVADNPHLTVNHSIYMSETLTGDRNRSLAYYMKSTGVISGNVEELLDVYFRLCSINVTCKDLARIGLILANNGIDSKSKKQIISKEICHIVKAVMSTCGLYNESGIFAATVGIPAKSGVGGGILAVVPKSMGIGVFSPVLNDKGNSIAGMKLLADLSHELDLSIY
mgnify:CR=1 FL=1